MPPLPFRDFSAFLVAALLLAAAVWTCQSVAPPALPKSIAAADAGFADLPARPGEAPVLSAQSAPVDRADAQARNAAIPYFAGGLEPAAPFRFSGAPQDQSRALECLALAAMAEAGPSDPGQRAVIQVVLNRVRHPAFAKTVCGVVFEGSSRATGCQFSFTCDGSLARRYGDTAWIAARERAAAMLGGAVYAPVGNATHYHTDWVHPYWSPKLVKLARVETHLFFRWPGYWGSRSAMRIPYRGAEPDPAVLAATGDSTQAPTSLTAAAALPDLPADTPKIGGGRVMMRAASGKANFIEIEPGTGPSGALIMAKLLCNAPGTCRVLGWRNRTAIPASFPLPPAARANLTFSYTRDPAGTEFVLYDCQTFPETPREQCIPRAR